MWHAERNYANEIATSAFKVLQVRVFEESSRV